MNTPTPATEASDAAVAAAIDAWFENDRFAIDTPDQIPDHVRRMRLAIAAYQSAAPAAAVGGDPADYDGGSMFDPPACGFVVDEPTVCKDIPDWAIAKSYRLAVEKLDPQHRVSALVFASDVTVAADHMARKVKTQYPYNPAQLAQWLRIHYRNSWDEPKTRIPEIVWIYETLLQLPLSITPDQMTTAQPSAKDGVRGDAEFPEDFAHWWNYSPWSDANRWKDGYRDVAYSAWLAAKATTASGLVDGVRALVTQWRHNAQGCGRNDSHAAGTWRSCARELGAAIGREVGE